MREILFRGKRKDNGEWVEGAFCQYDCPDPFGAAVEMPSIIKYGEPNSLFWFEVDPETVGQYTGLKDKNGKKIFEGDILEFDDVGEEGYEYKEGFDYKNRATVVFSKGRFELGNFMSTNSAVVEDMVCFCHEDFVSVFEENEVIGNIHDNPELLGVIV